MTDGPDGVKVTFENDSLERSERVFDKVLVSIGRRPNSEIPGLEHTKVEVDAKGFIKTDARRRTAEPTLYAIGDVAGEPMLAHKASHEARATVEGIHGEKVIFDPAAIPAVVFTDPELAWCGLTEDDAKKQGRRVEIAKFPWGASGRATTLDRNDGLTKLVIEPGHRARARRRSRRLRRRGADCRGRPRGRDGRARLRHQAHDPPASDAVGDGDGGGRNLLRPEHARVQAAPAIGGAALAAAGSQPTCPTRPRGCAPAACSRRSRSNVPHPHSLEQVIA